MGNNIQSSSTRILLIRHGETEWNRIHRFQGRSDIPLNQKGKAQAHALALALEDETLTAIYSSPLARATETAKIIKELHPSVPFFQEGGFLEMDLGEFEGMEAKHWAEQYPEFLKAWLERPGAVNMPGGESLQELQDRALGAIERITQIHPVDSTLLITSHNFVNLTILCYALGLSLDKFRDIRQGTTALNILYKQGERLWAEVVNDQSHLEKLNENGA